MVRAACVALVLAIPTLVHAGKLTAGASLGSSHDRKDDEVGVSGNQTIGLFGRLALTPRLSAQLELMKYERDALVVRTGTALLVVDLSAHPRWVPTIMVGMGIDRASAEPCNACAGYALGSDGRHIEGGFGLEYRATGGFTIGADIRLGGRSVDEEAILEDVPTLWSPSRLQASEYRAGRIWAGIRF